MIQAFSNVFWQRKNASLNHVKNDKNVTVHSAIWEIQPVVTRLTAKPSTEDTGLLCFHGLDITILDTLKGLIIPRSSNCGSAKRSTTTGITKYDWLTLEHIM